MDKKILVIGSTRIKNADSTTWGNDIPYLGDYDWVIVNMTTLNGSNFDHASKQFQSIKEELKYSLFGPTNLIIITAPSFSEDSYSPVLHNYSWLPFDIFFEEKSGKRFDKNKPKDEYFNQVDAWSHFYLGLEKESYSPRYRERHTIRSETLLRNKAGKALAFNLRIEEYDYHHSGRGRYYSNEIQFLPPTTKCSVDEGIEMLVASILASEEESLPDWTESILLPGENEMIASIEQDEEEMEKRFRSLTETKEKLANLQKFKKLLTEKSDALEVIVMEALNVLGFDAKDGYKTDEDGVLTDPSTAEEIPVEIGGMDKTVTAKKLRQLFDWTDSFETEKTVSKGVLIINPFIKTPLDEHLEGRGELIDEGLIQKAIPWDVTILPTIEIFKALKAKLDGENVDHFIAQVFDSTGLVTFNSKSATQQPSTSAESNK